MLWVLVQTQLLQLNELPYSGYFPGGKIFVDVQIFFHSWFNVRGVRRSRPHVDRAFNFRVRYFRVLLPNHENHEI